MTDDTTTEGEQDGQETAQEAPEGEQEPQDRQETEPETFPAEYVRKLRQEAAEARVKAKTADTLAQRLHTALVAGTGRLADPDDLPFDAEHLDDDSALTAALDDLLTRKPHLAPRRPAGDVGQGQRDGTPSVSWADVIRT